MLRHPPGLAAISHALLIGGVIVTAFPLYMAVIASTHDPATLAKSFPALPGDQFWNNLEIVLSQQLVVEGSGATIGTMLMNSMVMALSIAIGKIMVSIIAAYAIVYFRFPFRMLFFWMIFITLMLPVEVRIVPTYAVVANFGMLDSYWGLTVPLIASATATFLFRQVFMTIPDELAEAARIDGAGPIRFFFDIVLPLSRTNIAALFVILFVYGWNQYLWPLLITNDPQFTTVVMGLKRLIDNGERSILWNIIMLSTLIATLPPVIVVVVMQRLFVKGLVDVEK